MDSYFGIKFRERRESLGLSVQDVSNTTKILNVYIEALENDDFAALPQRVYAVGFVRCYSELLGFDADEMISLLLKNLPHHLSEDKQADLNTSRTNFFMVLLKNVRKNVSYISAVLAIICVVIFSKLING